MFCKHDSEVENQLLEFEFGVTLSAPMEFEKVDGVWMNMCV